MGGACSKKYCQSPHAKKKGKPCLKDCVEKCLRKVTIAHIWWFSSCAHCYIITYSFSDSSESLKGHSLSYHEIEQYVC